jgi:hypothetical protein
MDSAISEETAKKERPVAIRLGIGPRRFFGGSVLLWHHHFGCDAVLTKNVWADAGTPKNAAKTG